MRQTVPRRPQFRTQTRPRRTIWTANSNDSPIGRLDTTTENTIYSQYTISRPYFFMAEKEFAASLLRCTEQPSCTFLRTVRSPRATHAHTCTRKKKLQNRGIFSEVRSHFHKRTSFLGDVANDKHFTMLQPVAKGFLSAALGSVSSKAGGHDSPGGWPGARLLFVLGRTRFHRLVSAATSAVVGVSTTQFDSLPAVTACFSTSPLLACCWRRSSSALKFSMS